MNQETESSASQITDKTAYQAQPSEMSSRVSPTGNTGIIDRASNNQSELQYSTTTNSLSMVHELNQLSDFNSLDLTHLDNHHFSNNYTSNHRNNLNRQLAADQQHHPLDGLNNDAKSANINSRLASNTPTPPPPPSVATPIATAILGCQPLDQQHNLVSTINHLKTNQVSISSSNSLDSIPSMQTIDDAPTANSTISLMITADSIQPVRPTSFSTTAPMGDNNEHQQKSSHRLQAQHHQLDISTLNFNNRFNHLNSPYFGDYNNINNNSSNTFDSTSVANSNETNSIKRVKRTNYGNLKASRSLSVMIGTPKNENNSRHHHLSIRTPSPHRRALHHLYNQINPKSSPSNSTNPLTVGLYHSLFEERIIHCHLSIAHKKDFAEEVRALIDVKKFVSDSFILMNVTKTQVSEIIDYILEKLVKCRCLSDDVFHEARNLIYVEPKDQLLASTMQGIYKSRIDGRFVYDNSWILATCNLSTLNRRQVAIARLPYPVNFGRYSQEVRFVIIILVPSKEKMTKSAWETGRTFATMFTGIDFRRNLMRAKNQEEFKIELLTRAETLAQENSSPPSSTTDSLSLVVDNNNLELNNNHNSNSKNNTISIRNGKIRSESTSLSVQKNKSLEGSSDDDDQQAGSCCLGTGLVGDIKRRLDYYTSDFLDGIFGHHTLYKTTSTTIFLYFSVLLPCIAFGVVDTNNTEGIIDPKKTMIGQAVGGLLFAMFGGQPLVVVMTTAPLCIYVKVIYLISQDLEEDFLAFYACVGLWMALFLVIFSITNLSNLMRFCTRSTEDIFAIFTAFAFGLDGIKEAVRSFNKYYYEPECYTQGTILVSHTLDHSNKNLTATYTSALADLENGQHSSALGHELSVNHRCSRESCILFLFLMFGTLWLANSFNQFNQTPYLSMRKREIIKDYALAISVLIFSFIGTYLFIDIKLDVFEFSDFTGLQMAQVHLLSASTIGVSSILGFMLAILFYIDQNICGAMVNNAPYKLKKGDYFHLDLLVLAILNAFLSLTGFPWMQGKLPHSHLHSKALADYEERVDEGHVHQVIVNIRETRLTGILCSLLIGLSLLAVPYPLSYIPIPVLSGVFLYTAMSEFRSNSMIERICLFFTEQAAYPPNHYIRRCPQRKIHFFTIGQLIQLLLVCVVGFYPNPYVNMAFPLVVATFVPFREKILPWLIDAKYLDSLDSHN